MRFMVSVDFPSAQEDNGAAIVALLPQERAHITELTAQGVVEALYISADGPSRMWIVMHGASQEQVQQALETFPLYPYMQPTFIALR